MARVEGGCRVRHRPGGVVQREQSRSGAEDSGFRRPRGNWVLREAGRQAQSWVDAGLPPATVAVNVSAMEFGKDNFLEDVFTILRETPLAPRLAEQILRPEL